MTNYIHKAQLQVDEILATFIDTEVLPDLGVNGDQYWQSFSDIVHEFGAENRRLLAIREEMQTKLDDWAKRHHGDFDSKAYKQFLIEIGYLMEEGEDFKITTQNVDTEIANQAGPQLVVPTSNARFALNATNARWGSLYDALYGTDAIPEQDGAERSGAYNPLRGKAVIEFCRDFLDRHFPLSEGSHHDVDKYAVDDGVFAAQIGANITGLNNTKQYIGYQGDTQNPHSILLKNNNLHIIIEIDSNHPIGKTDRAGVKDITVEAALTTIQDFEDSVAAVDGEDKVGVYRNWLGLMRGDLTDSFDKNGKSMTRRCAPDRVFTQANGEELTLHGRSLLFCRNVGHLMSNPAILDKDGLQVQEGIMDAMVSVLIALHDLQSVGQLGNSRTGSIYIVKPKMHGPQEVAFANALFNRIEDELGLARHTIKIGVMDEERRTTVNLKECIRQVKERLVFINTGFLDRTGDEIHTSMLLGAMAEKAELKKMSWIHAYEDWNVDIGLECGLPGKAQIGKGMWAMPDDMANMMQQKIAHPEAGANTAWVPSPNAAILHALHYHQVNVAEQQNAIAARPRASLDDILSVPLLNGMFNGMSNGMSDKKGHDDSERLSTEEIELELENNAQGILGYVVRWVNQGVGCSKVPDINNVGLMEDRATLRISSQHICNWLEHGVCSEEQVHTTFQRMAAVVDAQNADDPDYQPMANNLETSMAYQAALALVFEGKSQPSGYTEPLLHAYRLKLKAMA